jgi:hypothetical protein
MTQTDVFADAQYLGPSEGMEAEIIIDNVTDDAPCFAAAMATRVETSKPGPLKTTSTYTVPPPPDTSQLKRQRKRKMIRAGLIGAMVGLLIGGPLGAILIGLGSAHVVKRINKKEEERIWAEYDQRVAQQAEFAVPMEVKPPPRMVRANTAEISGDLSLDTV